MHTGDELAVEAPAAAADGARLRRRPTIVSVVLPVRNGARHIGDQLDALARQTYSGRWEVVVVDNGCTDGTLAIVDAWRPRLPALVVVDASDRKGLNYARNRGAAAAQGELLAFCDADDAVTPTWLEGLAGAAVGHDLVCGISRQERLNGERTLAWYPPARLLAPKHGFLPHASGGNCAVWAEVARAVTWDETFAFGSSDIEFSWRVQLAGYSLGVADEAIANIRHQASLLGVARQYFKYGMSDAQLYRRFRGHGMSRRSVRDAASEWRRLVRRVGRLGPERARGAWVKRTARCLGRAAGSVRWRVLFL